MKHSKMGFTVNTRDDERWDKDLVVVRDVLESDGYKVEKLKTLIQPQTIIDIGGHIGAFALKAKSAWKYSKIFAFEPNIKNADLYRRNVIDNKLNNVSVYTEAVSYEKDKTILTDDHRATGGGFICTERQAANLETYFVSRIDIKLITLEELMVRDNIEKIDLLKIDCEGSEREIIKQMKDETAAKIGLIVGEYHIDGGYPKFEELFYAKFKHLKLVRKDPNNNQSIGEFFAVPPSLLKYY